MEAIGYIIGIAVCLLLEGNRIEVKTPVRIVDHGLRWEIIGLDGEVIHGDFRSYDDAAQYAIINKYDII